MKSHKINKNYRISCSFKLVEFAKYFIFSIIRKHIRISRIENSATMFCWHIFNYPYPRENSIFYFTDYDVSYIVLFESKT